MILLAKAPSLKNGHAATTTSARPRGTLHLFSLTRASDSLRDLHLGLRHPLQGASFRSISHSISHSDNRAKIENLDSSTCASHTGLGPRHFDYLDRGKPVAFGDPSADPRVDVPSVPKCVDRPLIPTSTLRQLVAPCATGACARRKQLVCIQEPLMFISELCATRRLLSQPLLSHEDTRCSAARCARAPLSFSQLTA
jgi:hypothetical protein